MGMRITAVSAYVPQRQTFPQRGYQPREIVTVVPPTPIQGGAMTAAILSGRGLIVDIVC
jgi:hypothetical protein